MILMEICIKGVAKNDDAKYNCEQQNSRTAEQQNSRTAEQQNSRTAEQQNSRTAEQHLILRLFLEPFIWQIV